MTQRSFVSNDDAVQMTALVRRSPGHHLHDTDLPYRLSSWALDDPQTSCLWFDTQGELKAWCVLQTPFWSIDYALHPEAKFLHPQILDWADLQARQVSQTLFGRPMWFVSVFADDTEQCQALEAAGFASQADVGENSWTKTWMKHTGPIPTAPLKTGFQIRPLSGHSEVVPYVALHRAVFGSENMTVEWRRRTLRHPSYRPELDLVAVSSDGELIGFCICWFDEESAIGQVEPMGVRENFRGAGIGKALLAEGLRRLRALGAAAVFVETDHGRDAALALYRSCGFVAFRDVLVYRKDYPPPLP